MDGFVYGRADYVLSQARDNGLPGVWDVAGATVTRSFDT